MRLDRDSKQPIWLGLILIFAAFIFTLFFITSVRADDEVSEPPHDPQYNNLVFITVSDKMYIGGDTVIDLYTGASDGANAIAWKNNFSSNLSGFFQFVSKDQCFFIIASDGANAGFLNSIREVLSDLGASYWSGEQDGFWNPDHDLSGYEDQRAPFGIYNVRYMSRIVKYLPVVSPSPTPELDFQTFEYSYGYSTDGLRFSMYLVSLSFVPDIFEQDLDSTTNALLSFYNKTDRLLSHPALILADRISGGSAMIPSLGFYFQASALEYCHVYNYGVYEYSNIPSFSFDFIKSNYDYTDFSVYSNFIPTNGVSGQNLFLQTQSNGSCYAFVHQGANYYCNFSGLDYSSLDSSYFFDATSFARSEYRSPFYEYAYLNLNSPGSTTFYAASLVARLNLNDSSQTPDPVISPTPSPSATPEPLPTSPESIHVILPTGTPSPTPPFSVPAEDPGGGSGSPGGSFQGSLTPGQVNSTLNTFKQYTQNNGAFAFLYACTSLIPDDALYFLFILLFILLLLACLRLFVHFTGG